MAPRKEKGDAAADQGVLHLEASERNAVQLLTSSPARPWSWNTCVRSASSTCCPGLTLF